LKSLDVAKKGLERAGRWLRGAEVALDEERWDDVVYSAQMAVEQASKAVLFALGVDFPRQHDVSGVLIDMMDREDLPGDFRGEIPQIAAAIRELAEQRGLAGYGFEEGITADYFEDYAPQAYEMARKVHQSCKAFLRQTFHR